MSTQNRPQIDLETVVARTQEILFDRVGQEVVMINLEEGRYFIMDEIAAEIWACLATPVRVGDVCAALTDKFEVTPETCQRDVLAFLERLGEKNLLQIQE